MEIQQNMASLLSAHMKKADVGDARLAKRVNSANNNAYFIHRSTIRNWRTGSTQKANDWRKLAAISAALGLDENDADELLQSARCPSIRVLKATIQEADRIFLAYWENSSAQAADWNTVAEFEESDTPPLEVSSVNNFQWYSNILLKLKQWKFACTGLLVILSAFTMFEVLSPGFSRFLDFGGSNDPKNLLSNSHFEKGTSDWISYANREAVAEFEVIDEAMSIQIKQAGIKAWHISLNQKGLELSAGKFYTARFRVRGDGVTSMEVNITRVVHPRTSLSFDNSEQQHITTTKNWTTKSIEFEAIETITLKEGGARLFFKLGRSDKGWIQLDDIEFFEGKLTPNEKTQFSSSSLEKEFQ